MWAPRDAGGRTELHSDLTPGDLVRGARICLGPSTPALPAQLSAVPPGRCPAGDSHNPALWGSPRLSAPRPCREERTPEPLSGGSGPGSAPTGSCCPGAGPKVMCYTGAGCSLQGTLTAGKHRTPGPTPLPDGPRQPEGLPPRGSVPSSPSLGPGQRPHPRQRLSVLLSWAPKQSCLEIRCWLTSEGRGQSPRAQSHTGTSGGPHPSSKSDQLGPQPLQLTVGGGETLVPRQGGGVSQPHPGPAARAPPGRNMASHRPVGPWKLGPGSGHPGEASEGGREGRGPRLGSLRPLSQARPDLLPQGPGSLSVERSAADGQPGKWLSVSGQIGTPPPAPGRCAGQHPRGHSGGL